MTTCFATMLQPNLAHRCACLECAFPSMAPCGQERHYGYHFFVVARITPLSKLIRKVCKIVTKNDRQRPFAVISLVLPLHQHSRMPVEKFLRKYTWKAVGKRTYLLTCGITVVVRQHVIILLKDIVRNTCE